MKKPLYNIGDRVLVYWFNDDGSKYPIYGNIVGIILHEQDGQYYYYTKAGREEYEHSEGKVKLIKRSDD